MDLPLKKFIVCLDHTDRDKHLIENAYLLTTIADAEEIIFLNVIKDFHLPEEMTKEFPDLLEKAIEDRKTELSGLVSKSLNSKIKTKLRVLQGTVSKEILSAASEEKADLIIMGRTHGDESSILSTRIARRSPCSLLLIPQKTKLKFDKILIPVDFSDYSRPSLERALSLTKNQKSTIYLHNVISVPSSYRYSGKSYSEFAKIIQGHTEKDLAILTHDVKTTGQELQPVFTTEDGKNIIDLIWKESDTKKVDLIIMGAKGRTSAAIFIGSKAERMIRINDTTPLMIIRKKGEMAGIIQTIMEQFD